MAVELLAPAGNAESLRMAVTYGADAVYLGGTLFGMRAFADNFDEKGLCDAVMQAHSCGKKVHVACNTMPRNDELLSLPPYLELLADIGVDAIIIGDAGVFTLARKYAPKIPIHISTQIGVANVPSVHFWHDLGAARVILARELSLEEVRTICSEKPKGMEIEAFVHGAMCVSFSGRCVLSNYMTGRDASRGCCAQPCRYRYALMEEKRPGEFFPVAENGQGTYIFNSKDMCMIEHIPDLISAGLDSLKIEGRAKSSYYTAVVTNAYRHVLDAAIIGQPPDTLWIRETDYVSHRPYSTGFWYGHPEEYTGDARYIRNRQIGAVILSCRENGEAVLSVRNKLETGENVELVTPDAPPFALPLPDIKSESGVSLPLVNKPLTCVRCLLPRKVPPYSLIRKIV